MNVFSLFLLIEDWFTFTFTFRSTREIIFEKNIYLTSPSTWWRNMCIIILKGGNFSVKSFVWCQRVLPTVWWKSGSALNYIFRFFFFSKKKKCSFGLGNSLKICSTVVFAQKVFLSTSPAKQQNVAVLSRNVMTQQENEEDRMNFN